MAAKGKYTPALVKQICDLIRQDTYTIKEVCVIVGISQETYYDWYKSKPEFTESIQRAEVEQKHFFKAEAKKSLLKLVQGYEYDETKTTVSAGKGKSKKKKKSETGKEEKPEITEVIKIRKHVPPSPTAVIFTLTNTDPGKWKNRQINELTGADGKELFIGMTDEELEKRMRKLNSLKNLCKGQKKSNT